MLNTPRPANPYSPQPNPATLSLARRLSPVIPAPSYTPRVTPAPNPRRQPLSRLPRLRKTSSSTQDVGARRWRAPARTVTEPTTFALPRGLPPSPSNATQTPHPHRRDAAMIAASHPHTCHLVAFGRKELHTYSFNVHGTGSGFTGQQEQPVPVRDASGSYYVFCCSKHTAHIFFEVVRFIFIN